MSTKQESKTTVSHLPEHGPIDENGREILLQVKNVDITFGKGDDAVKAVKNASFDIYKGETFSLVGRVRFRKDHDRPCGHSCQPVFRRRDPVQGC